MPLMRPRIGRWAGLRRSGHGSYGTPRPVVIPHATLVAAEGAGPYLGGFTITSMGWLGPRAVFVDFETTYINKFHQLYAGKELIGVTSALAETRIVGQLDPSPSPRPILLLAVQPADRLTDFSSGFPPRPWNRFDLDWSGVGMPADTKEFIVTSGTIPGGAVDDSNELGRVPFTSAGLPYTFHTDPVDEGGLWNLRVRAIDNARPSGNVGTAANVSDTAYIHPPDVLMNASGGRLTATVVNGIVAIDFDYNF